MAFHIYPDTETAWELSKPDFTPIALAPGEAIALYIPLDAMIGPDLAAGDQPTTFVRIAQVPAPGLRPRRCAAGIDRSEGVDRSGLGGRAEQW